MDFEDTYITGAYITGVITFFGIWIYAFASWGFLVGLAIGWLPAMIGAYIFGFLWPLILLVVVLFLMAGLFSYFGAEIIGWGVLAFFAFSIVSWIHGIYKDFKNGNYSIKSMWRRALEYWKRRKIFLITSFLIICFLAAISAVLGFVVG